jgi:hypothetical protein
MTYRISNFARTKGAKDKQERKKRGVGGYIAGGVAGAAGLGAAARYGIGKAGSQAQQMARDTDSAKLKELFKARSQAGQVRRDQVKSAVGYAKNKVEDAIGNSGKWMKGNPLKTGAAVAGAIGTGAYLYNRNKKKKAAEAEKTLGGRASALKSKIKERLGR